VTNKVTENESCSWTRRRWGSQQELRGTWLLTIAVLCNLPQVFLPVYQAKPNITL